MRVDTGMVMLLYPLLRKVRDYQPVKTRNNCNTRANFLRSRERMFYDGRVPYRKKKAA